MFEITFQKFFIFFNFIVFYPKLIRFNSYFDVICKRCKWLN
ncbi:MAG: hypothetical protein Metus_0766 [Candidatus Methanosuratincola subterraneus]|uniref:Uncharacterized protein n=1 Tax=Methanosuratincola subterraneus TaxID=2593994 RepID=A0A444L533_METS7|nr:MAG: hypothetical protein Metus_0766 [Candidatus Methanosuratincola subterraneus]